MEYLGNRLLYTASNNIKTRYCVVDSSDERSKITSTYEKWQKEIESSWVERSHYIPLQYLKNLLFDAEIGKFGAFLEKRLFITLSLPLQDILWWKNVKRKLWKVTIFDFQLTICYVITSKIKSIFVEKIAFIRKIPYFLLELNLVQTYYENKHSIIETKRKLWHETFLIW